MNGECVKCFHPFLSNFTTSDAILKTDCTNVFDNIIYTHEQIHIIY